MLLSLLFLQCIKETIKMRIATNLLAINKKLGKSTKLVAISKTKPVEMLMECYDAGQRIFGENKVQEMLDKQAAMPNDVQWHLVGHLQTNKVKYIAPFVSLIHSADSIKLIQEINKQGAKHHRIISCLLQIYIAKEETKFGLDIQEALDLLQSESFTQMQNIRVMGVMGMATNTENLKQVREEFQYLKQFSDTLKLKFASDIHPLHEISMGMSSDFEIAIEEGSTLVRVGSSIFGIR